jgi:hypothetical protein
MQVKLLGFISVDFDVRGQLLSMYCTSEKLRMQWDILSDFKIAYNSVSTGFLYSILSEFGILMELVRLIYIYICV